MQTTAQPRPNPHILDPPRTEKSKSHATPQTKKQPLPTPPALPATRRDPRTCHQRDSGAQNTRPSLKRPRNFRSGTSSLYSPRGDSIPTLSDSILSGGGAHSSKVQLSSPLDPLTCSRARASRAADFGVRGGREGATATPSAIVALSPGLVLLMSVVHEVYDVG